MIKTYDYVILGGGLAGLCAAKRLLELGIQPLVIEGGSYPAHKVCGEFLSPSSLPILKKWDLAPIPIKQALLHTSSQTLKFHFPTPAGSLSHVTLDDQLAKQIVQQGGKLLTQTKVLDLSPSSYEGEFHHLSLSSGEKIKAKQLFIATGRLPCFSSPSPLCYRGFKAHFSGLELDSTLYLFSFRGAYLGISPIENGHANLACLTTHEYAQHFSCSGDLMQRLINSHPLLSEILASGHNLFNDWMEASVPEFGIRKTPDWPHTYSIGDAASTIPPASGNGLSLAIASGYLAAEFAIREDAMGFKEAWKKRCSSQIQFAKGLHRLFLNPSWGSLAIRFNHLFPFMGQKLFQLTRDPRI